MRPEDLPEMIRIWNQVVEEGEAFPQTQALSREAGQAFFEEQTYCAAAEDTQSGAVCGLYILHPNNIGRCGHIANASFAVDRARRGLGTGEALVKDCLEQGKRHGFRILQFNAVVAGNLPARHLYEKLGFRLLGTIPEGFCRKNGQYADICKE